MELRIFYFKFQPRAEVAVRNFWNDKHKAKALFTGLCYYLYSIYGGDVWPEIKHKKVHPIRWFGGVKYKCNEFFYQRRFKAREKGLAINHSEYKFLQYII